MKPPTLRIVVRRDLDPGRAAAQAIHAAREFQKAHPVMEASWHEGSNTVAVLTAPPEDLTVLADKLRDWEIPHGSFREPDLDDALTALAIPGWDPVGNRLTRSLPLLG